ncbi:copper resistance D family protein [Aquibacillus sediminis]|uniref:copper resistance D family protein n=1 Tax=Aquibacillus sediminis TaxID=2574734 RepID=UPI001FE4989D|nr:CopD family protein [Aquibacillus sediminis]
MSKRYMIMATIGVALFSFTPVLVLILNLQENLGWQAGLQTVLLTFDIGNAWIFTTIVVMVLFVFIVTFYQPVQTKYSWAGCLLTFILMIGLAWSSHASSLEQAKGVLTHLAHFTAVSIWIGVLFVVSWFSKNYVNWLQFLYWFTPIAIGCVLVTTASGILLMSFFMDLSQYPDSWTVDYGQFLLIKHLLIISLFVYAVVNGIFIRKKLIKAKNFNPIPWVKAESIVALLIFSITAAMGQQAPPSASTPETDGLSFLFEFFYQGQYYPGMEVQLSVNMLSIFLIIIALLFLVMIFYAFFKKASTMITFLLSVLFVCSSYLALIMSIS